MKGYEETQENWESLNTAGLQNIKSAHRPDHTFG